MNKLLYPWELIITLRLENKYKEYQEKIKSGVNINWLPNKYCANQGNSRIVDMFTFL